jgi:hypothetical protein
MAQVVGAGRRLGDAADGDHTATDGESVEETRSGGNLSLGRAAVCGLAARVRGDDVPAERVFL